MKLPPLTAAISANVTQTLVVKLPKRALEALKHHAKESVLFTLTASNANGKSATTLKIARLTAKR